MEKWKDLIKVLKKYKRYVNVNTGQIKYRRKHFQRSSPSILKLNNQHYKQNCTFWLCETQGCTYVIG